MKNNMSLYWIGVRESEIEATGNLFSGSITIYGSNNENNYAFDKKYKYRINCNTDSEEWIKFVNKSVEKIVNKDNRAAFLLYYPEDYPYFSDLVKDRVICMNDPRIIEFMENKIMTKLWLSKYMKTTPLMVLKGNQISVTRLQKSFEGFNSFVVQYDSSCSGSGTWLLSEETSCEIEEKIAAESAYIVSPYYSKSVSVNVHVVIFNDNICILPPSVQIIILNNNSFCYNGADFIAYNTLSEAIKNEVTECASTVGKKLQEIGYRGVCGVDLLIYSGEVFFMEINPRFQASTMAINCAFEINRVDMSVQKMHIEAFLRKDLSLNLSKFSVDCSFCYFTYDEKYLQRLKYLYSLKNTDSAITFIDDSIDWSMKFEKKAYLFELLFETNIVSINPEGRCNVDQNTIIDSNIIKINKFADDKLALKIMLLNQGIRLSERATNYANSNGGLNYEEFCAIDVEFDDIYINIPYKTRLSQISPFEIDVDENNYNLLYFGQKLGNVKLRYKNEIGEKRINNNFICDDITYLGNDRLRIFFRNSCYYKRRNLSCKFCDIVNDEKDFGWEEIKTAIDYYWGCDTINHYLIGGGADSPSSNFSQVIEISSYLRSKTNKPIALMSLPPQKSKSLEKLKESGITEVVFNLEVYNRDIAKKLMPGKGNISLDTYIKAFKKSVELWGNDGKVRTMFIVGLESEDSLLEGIETVCKIGVSPTLSLFKPIAGTDTEYILPPSNLEIYNICKKTIEICAKYGVPLGPSCRYCEDNVLKVYT